MQMKHKERSPDLSIWGSQRRLIAEVMTTFNPKGQVELREAEKSEECGRISSRVEGE